MSSAVAARGRGGIGRHAGFRFLWREPVRVRVSPPAPSQQQIGWNGGRDAGGGQGGQSRRERCRYRDCGRGAEAGVQGHGPGRRDREPGADAGWTQLAKTVRLPGFRPGKAPLPLLKKQYGRSIMGEVLEEAVDEGSKKTIGDNQLRPALRPKIEVTSFDEGKDLEFELKRRGAAGGAAGRARRIALTRLVAEVADRARSSRRSRASPSRARSSSRPAEPRPAADGDQLMIDFEGRIDGEPFEGGSRQGLAAAAGLASGMIPGFEEQLVGAHAGRDARGRGDLPGRLRPSAEVAGKDAVFTVTVKEVKAPVPIAHRRRLGQGAGPRGPGRAQGRRSAKRFTDEYQQPQPRRGSSARCSTSWPTATQFAVPQGMVDLEFDAIWKQLAGRDASAPAARSTSRARPRTS